MRVSIDDGILIGIADAIRGQYDETEPISPLDFAELIEAIEGGGGEGGKGWEEIEITPTTELPYITFESQFDIEDIDRIECLYVSSDKCPSSSTAYISKGIWYVNYFRVANATYRRLWTEQMFTTWGNSPSVASYVTNDAGTVSNIYIEADGSTIKLLTYAYGSTSYFAPNKTYLIRVYLKDGVVPSGGSIEGVELHEFSVVSDTTFRDYGKLEYDFTTKPDYILMYSDEANNGSYDVATFQRAFIDTFDEKVCYLIYRQLDRWNLFTPQLDIDNEGFSLSSGSRLVGGRVYKLLFIYRKETE